MKKYDVLVIGFGKGGKTLAAKLASLGKKVALVEKNPSMFGGTCINIGCIPTKTLIHAADETGSFEYAMADKEAVVSRLRQKNYDTLSAIVDIFVAEASFVSDYVVELSANNDKKQITAETIIINTGATSVVPDIEGILSTKNVFDSTGIQQLDKQPKTLGIIGSGNIGLEFASLYATLGTKVTVIDPFDVFLPRVEAEISSMAKQYLSEAGITFQLGEAIYSVENQDEQVLLKTTKRNYVFDAVLYATGRKPATDKLGLHNTNINVNERGAIVVDEFCQTNVKNVFAVGDVNGGLQFTYISLDDFRIVFNFLNGNTNYSLKQRSAVPNSLFINPPLSQVGLTEKQALEQEFTIKTKTMAVAGMPRAHVDGDLRGAYKVVVDEKTNNILGATLLGNGSPELINLITLAINHHIPASALANQIYTHPTMAENFNDLFAL